ncbi:MAG: hypothetical protein ACI4DO_03560, partial [Roseburia sp.]
MKKKILLSMALLSATVVAGSTPVISQAAEVKTSQIVSNKCYKVYVGQGCESLAQILNGICSSLGNDLSSCPGVEKPEMPELPNMPNSPETSAPPVAESPDTQEPEISVPENSVPDQETLSYAEQVVKLVNEER